MKTCIICKEGYEGYGNSALPLKDGLCCNKCNGKVILERIKRFKENSYKNYEEIENMVDFEIPKE